MKKFSKKVICFLLAVLVCLGNFGTETVQAATTKTASLICSRHGGRYNSYLKGDVYIPGKSTDSISVYGIQYNGKKYKGSSEKIRHLLEYWTNSECERKISSKESFRCFSKCKLKYNYATKTWKINIEAQLSGKTGGTAGQDIKFMIRIVKRNGQENFRLYKFQAPTSRRCTEKITYYKKNARYHQKVVTCSVLNKVVKRVNVQHSKNCRLCR